MCNCIFAYCHLEEMFIVVVIFHIALEKKATITVASKIHVFLIMDTQYGKSHVSQWIKSHIAIAKTKSLLNSSLEWKI